MATILAIEILTAGILIILVWFVVGLIVRRPLQFGVLSLLSSFLAVVVPCAWLVVEIIESRQELPVIAAIEKLGGTVCTEGNFGQVRGSSLLEGQSGKRPLDAAHNCANATRNLVSQ